MTATENRPVENEAAQKAFSGADMHNSTIGLALVDGGAL